MTLGKFVGLNEAMRKGHDSKDPAAAAAEMFKRRPHTGSGTKVG